MKDALRVLRHIVSMFSTTWRSGTTAQRNRFAKQVIRRLARLFGFYTACYIALRIGSNIAGMIRQSSGLTGWQRFPRWWLAVAGLDNRDYLRSWTTRRYTDGPKIVVLGVGSLGDILQITPVLRALRDKVPTAELILLHRSPAATMVLQGNGNVDSVAVANAYNFAQIKRAVNDEGAADLVVEIASVSYILTYTVAPLALRHPALCAVFADSFFAAAKTAQAAWKHHPPIFPRRTAKFVWPKEWKDFHYLDVLGVTGKLSIDRYSPLDFIIDSNGSVALSLISKGSYVTIHNGVDADVMNHARATGRRPTKLLPKATWEETVRLLQAKDLAVVQLGTNDDERIEGVDTDLRGRTTLRQAAVILQNAVCHVGVEGGLIHLARAMGTPSVVAFGPTSTSFLGYPQNINLVASDCTGCWWTTTDWYIHCPRGLKQPECMSLYTAAMIAEAALSIFQVTGTADKSTIR